MARWHMWCWALLQRQRLLRPDEHIPSLSQLSGVIQRQSPRISHVILDKDNCVCEPTEWTVHPAVQPIIGELRARFPAISWYILTNDDGRHQGRDRRTGVDGLPVLNDLFKERVKKPAGGPQILPILQADDPRTVMIVGDRVLTDILLGTWNNFRTVLVDPLDAASGKESLGVRWMRWLERRLLLPSPTIPCKDRDREDRGRDGDKEGG